MALHLALVAASQWLGADLVAMRYCVVTRGPLAAELLQGRLATRAMVNHIWRLRTMWSLGGLLVASLLTEVLATVISSLAHVVAFKRASPALNLATAVRQTTFLPPAPF